MQGEFNTIRATFNPLLDRLTVLKISDKLVAKLQDYLNKIEIHFRCLIDELSEGARHCSNLFIGVVDDFWNFKYAIETLKLKQITENSEKNSDNNNNNVTTPIDRENEVNLDNIFIDIFIAIMNNLSIRDICTVSMLCKTLEQIIHSPEFWKLKVRIHFPHVFETQISSPRECNWYNLYKITYKIEYSGLCAEEREFLTWVKEGNFKKIKSWPLPIIQRTTDANGKNLIYWAARNGHYQVVNWLLSKLEDRFVRPEKAAREALLNGHLDIYQLIISKYPSQIVFDLEDLKQVAQRKHSNSVRYLLSQGIINGISEEDFYITLHTIKSGKIVEILLLYWTEKHDTSEQINSLFRKAALNDHCDLAEIILKKFGNVNPSQTCLDELICSAVSQGKLKLVKLLLEKYPIKISKDELLWLASAGGSIEMVEYLVSIGASVNEHFFLPPDNYGKRLRCSPLYLACRNGHDKVVTFLLEKGADVNDITMKSTTSLHVASSNGLLAIVDILVEKGATVDSVDERGRTPLLVAISAGQIQVIELLLANDANIKCTDANGEGVLHYFIELIMQHRHDIERFLPMLELLLARGATYENREGNSLLHVFCKKNLLKAVEFLLQRKQINVNIKNDLGETPLHYAVDSIGIVKLLVENGADINSEDDKGDIVLHFYFRTFRYLNISRATLDYLFQCNADINHPNNNGITPFHYAAEISDYEMLEFLIKNGGNKSLRSRNGDTILHFACRNKYDAVQLIPFLTLGNEDRINQENNDGVTILHYAAQRGNIELLKLLIKNNADVSKKDHNNSTLLHYAAKNQEYAGPILRYLVDDLAMDINAANAEGATPLHYLADNYTFEPTIISLVLRGAKLTLRDKNQKTPIQLMNLDLSSDFISFLIYGDNDVDCTHIELSKYKAYYYKELIEKPKLAGSIFYQAIELLQNPPALFLMTQFLSPTRNMSDSLLQTRLEKLLDRSREIDPRYFDKCLFNFLNKKNSLSNRFFSFLLNSRAVLSTENPKVLLILAGFAREGRLLSLQPQAIIDLYKKAAKNFKKQKDYELDMFANEMAENISKVANENLNY